MEKTIQDKREQEFSDSSIESQDYDAETKHCNTPELRSDKSELRSDNSELCSDAEEYVVIESQHEKQTRECLERIKILNDKVDALLLALDRCILKLQSKQIETQLEDLKVQQPTMVKIWADQQKTTKL